MSTNWKNWCRLCAKHEGNNDDFLFKLDTIMELSVLVQKYFSITISPYDDAPTAICNDCVKFVLSVEKYAVRCIKVDKMYSELVYIAQNMLETDLHSIRYKYGLDEEEKFKNLGPIALSDGSNSYFPNNHHQHHNQQQLQQQQQQQQQPQLNQQQPQHHADDQQNLQLQQNRPLKLDQSTDTFDLVQLDTMPSLSNRININVKNEEIEQIVVTPPLTRVTRGRRSRKKLPDDKIIKKPIKRKLKTKKSAEFSDNIPNAITVKKEEKDGDRFIGDDNTVGGNGGGDFDDEDGGGSDDDDDDDDPTFELAGSFDDGRGDVDSIEESDYGDEDDEVGDGDELEHSNRIFKPKRKTRKPPKEVFQTCLLCNKEFNRTQNYEKHMRTKHSHDEWPFVCSKCPKRFTTEKKLQIHENVHLPHSEKMVHPCPYCDKKFSRPLNVQAHIRAIHIGDRPFICEECGKSFGTRGALKEHQITHSDERPFQCAHCPKKFKNLPRLKTHEDIHNATVYVCPHCGLQLNTKRTLKMHMVVHSDQKKYKCQYCGNEYKRSKALKNHLILHTGLRPYLCPFCDKTFANGSNCRSHKKKSHPMELAALEASGEVQRATNIPKLEHLQPKPNQLQQIQEMMEVAQTNASATALMNSNLAGTNLDNSQIKPDPMLMSPIHLQTAPPSISSATTTTSPSSPPNCISNGLPTTIQQHQQQIAIHHHQQQQQQQQQQHLMNIPPSPAGSVHSVIDNDHVLGNLRQQQQQQQQLQQIPTVPTNNL